MNDFDDMKARTQKQASHIYGVPPWVTGLAPKSMITRIRWALAHAWFSVRRLGRLMKQR